MAGVWTSVCVMFPALDAKAAGFKVYAVIDASGDPSEMASRTTLARFVQAGVDPDLDQRRTVRDAPHLEPPRGRPNSPSSTALVAPNYAAVIESYQKAQEVGRQAR